MLDKNKHHIIYLSEKVKRFGSGKPPAKNSSRKGKDYKSYSAEALQKAIDEVRFGSMNARQAAQFYGVPVGTVYDRVAKLNELEDRRHSCV